MNILAKYKRETNSQYTTFVLTLLLLLCALSFSQESKAQTNKRKNEKNSKQNSSKEPSSKKPIYQGVYYEISKEGLKHTSYIYGTMHAVCIGPWQLPEIVKEGISNVYTVYMEINLGDKEELNAAMQGAMLPPDSTLDKFFTKEEFEQLHKIAVDSFRINLKMLKTVSPLAISGLMMNKFLGCFPTAVDLEIKKWANKKTRNLYGLETTEQQLKALRNISYKEQAAELADILRNQKQSKEELLALVNAYYKDELQKIDSLVNSSELSAKTNFNAQLLAGRNQKWMEKLSPQLKNEATFIAVGAAHLSGNEGMLKLLQKEGYQIKPIPLQKVNP